MPYLYDFDETVVGVFRVKRSTYEIVHAGLVLLKDKLESWNQQALAHGGSSRPYEREVEDLRGLIEWGQSQLANRHREWVVERRSSVGNLRYIKAALCLVIANRKKDRESKAKIWPQAALLALDDNIQKLTNIAANLKVDPSDVLWEAFPKTGGVIVAPEAREWDVFVCHASEDKEEFARPLAESLQERGLRVWFDEFTLTIGDSLRRSIDKGLARSRFGIVIVSPHFLHKEWAQKELDGLVSQEIAGKKVILPVWHNIEAEASRAYSPMLADRVAASSKFGLNKVVDQIMEAIRRDKLIDPEPIAPDK